jgi:hypothetical protein
MYWESGDVSMLCCGALFWCCYDAHLNDLPKAGRTGARHPGYSLLRRHETAGAISEGSPWLMWFGSLTAMSGNRGDSSSFSVMTRQELQRVCLGDGVFWSWRRNAVYCSSCSRRSKE